MNPKFAVLKLNDGHIHREGAERAVEPTEGEFVSFLPDLTGNDFYQFWWAFYWFGGSLAFHGETDTLCL